MVFSIFSNYLEPLGVKNCKETKPSEIYNQLRIAYNQGARGILESTRLVALRTADEYDYDILYEIWKNPLLHHVVRWINEKILLNLGILDYRTIDVRIRIATSMLNQLVKTGDLQYKLNIDIHDIFVNNVRREMSAINTEDLPFLGRKPNGIGIPTARNGKDLVLAKHCARPRTIHSTVCYRSDTLITG